MKKLLIICAFLLGVVGFANAQGGRQQGTPEERAKRSTDLLVERLKLNADQTTKVTAIYLDNVKEQTKMREEGGGDREAMMAKMQKMQAEVNTKIEALLTDDQKKEYKVVLEERAKQMQNRGGGGGE